MLNIVLLGGTGFVGSAIIRQISELNEMNIKVRALVRGDIGRIQSPCVKSVMGALPESIPESLFPREPHVVVHFATKQMDPDRSGFHTANIEGTRQLLNALPKSTKGVIYGSSMSVYGQGAQEFITEEGLVAPETDLAKTRAGAEKLIMDEMRRRNGSAFLLRPRFILGEGDRYTLKGFKTMARKGFIAGTGAQAFSIIDVDDYARLVLLLAESVMRREQEKIPLCRPFNIGYHRPVSLNEIIGSICRVSGAAKPGRKIPVSPLLTRLLRALPFSGSRSLATKLELVGLSHSGSVAALEDELKSDITQKDPIKVFAKLLKAKDHEFNKLDNINEIENP